VEKFVPLYAALQWDPFILQNAALIQILSFRPLHYSFYRVFHGFGQAKFADSGSILGMSQLSMIQYCPSCLQK